MPLTGDEKTRTAMAVLRAKIVSLQDEIRKLAAEGRTMECDDRHGQIATLESAMAILNGEYDD